ncbi:MAG: hypothetical protein COA98_01520 [Candidatus Neomarinimicrobiota bacterium]|nr:MAG: hypothetical protein COA98_01520 [Candidatus Neomarinimicrobiota bacterium]HIN46111.1 DUF309 domain-containing protein [Candidatus Neomarinimicrobiota bacterium]
MKLKSEILDKDDLIQEDLFLRGVKAFNERDFFEAHELWEELWSEYNLSDRIFVQGMIQAAVGFYHLFTDNLKGAKSLIQKSLNKLHNGSETIQWSKIHRNIDVEAFVKRLNICLEKLMVISDCSEFNLELVPSIVFTSKSNDG